MRCAAVVGLLIFSWQKVVAYHEKLFLQFNLFLIRHEFFQSQPRLIVFQELQSHSLDPNSVTHCAWVCELAYFMADRRRFRRNERRRRTFGLLHWGWGPITAGALVVSSSWTSLNPTAGRTSVCLQETSYISLRTDRSRRNTCWLIASWEERDLGVIADWAVESHRKRRLSKYLLTFMLLRQNGDLNCNSRLAGPWESLSGAPALPKSSLSRC